MGKTQKCYGDAVYLTKRDMSGRARQRRCAKEERENFATPGNLIPVSYHSWILWWMKSWRMDWKCYHHFSLPGIVYLNSSIQVSQILQTEQTLKLVFEKFSPCWPLLLKPVDSTLTTIACLIELFVREAWMSIPIQHLITELWCILSGQNSYKHVNIRLWYLILGTTGGKKLHQNQWVLSQALTRLKNIQLWLKAWQNSWDPWISQVT